MLYVGVVLLYIFLQVSLYFLFWILKAFNGKFCLFVTIAVDQILTHWFATMLLALRYAFRQARDCVVFRKYYIDHYS